jgi:Mg-chelatase subunit ChlD
MPPTNIVTHDLIFILDRSGSMSSMGDEPMQAVNSFVEEQLEASFELKDKATFTLYTFNTQPELVYDDQPLANVKPYTYYKPSGMTCLYDTIGYAINRKLSKEVTNNVICVILTDGADNSSRTYNSESIKKLMNKVERKNNWNFMFLAANQDAFAAGGAIGVQQTQCASYEATPNGMREGMRCASDSVRAYRTGTVKTCELRGPTSTK